MLRVKTLRDIYESWTFALIVSDLGTFEEVEKSYLWRQAMADEINSSQRNGTWELYELPSMKKKLE